MHIDFRVPSTSLILVWRGQSLFIADSRRAPRRSESVHVDGARVGASIDVPRASRRGLIYMGLFIDRSARKQTKETREADRNHTKDH